LKEERKKRIKLWFVKWNHWGLI